MTETMHTAGPATLSPFDLFQWLSPATQEAFNRCTHIRRVAKGGIFYADGDAADGMYRVVSGAVRIARTAPDGREFVYALFGPGDCFGINNCIDLEPRAHTAEAGSDCEVAMLGKEAFCRLREQSREFDNALLQLFSRYVRKLSHYVSEADFDELPTRIAGRLLDATRSIGVRSGSGAGLTVRVSQAELALMVGSSRQSVNKVLQHFRRQGLITLEYGAFIVREEEQLARIAKNAGAARNLVY